MRRLTFVPLVLFLCLSGNVYAQGTVIETSFYSAALGSDRFVQIYLPEGYKPVGDTDYPVIYFLHGAFNDHTGYPFIVDILDVLIGNQVIEPVIVVKPNGQSYPYVASWYTNSMLNGFFEDYIVNDLIAFIEANYRAIPDRNERFIMGHSAGGYGTMALGLKHPDIYARLASHSGVLEFNVMMAVAHPYLLAEYPEGPPYNWNPAAGFFSGIAFSMAGAFSPNLANPPYYVDFPLDNMGNVIEAVFDKWLLHNPPKFAAELPPGSDIAIFFDCGIMDELGCYPQNTTFEFCLDQLGLDCEFQAYVGDHANQLPNRFPVGIAFLVGIKATLDLQPARLNLQSSGNWVTCYIELPIGYSVGDIDLNTVAITMINDESFVPLLFREGPCTIGDYDGDGINDMMVKFDRQELISLLSDMSVEDGEEVVLTVSGDLPGGISFQDVATIEVLNRGRGDIQGRTIAGHPKCFFLYQNSPNPFEYVTTIRYDLRVTAQVILEIYSVTGQKVATLVDNEQTAGCYSLSWMGKDSSGNDLANGVYFYKLAAGDYDATRKLLLLR